MDQEIPRQWYCPISQELMRDPVLAADGFTYQRKQIEQWLKISNISPITGAPLPNRNVIPNHALRHTIEQYNLKNAGKISFPPAQHHEAAFVMPKLSLETDSIVDDGLCYVSCEIVPPASPLKSRNSASIICIIDISQSMDTDSVLGGKDVESHGFSRLDLVKHSISTMVEFMEENDEITLITFNNSAKVRLPPTKTTKGGKNLIRMTLQDITASGTTNIWDGLKVCLELLKKTSERKQTFNEFVVLLTDGEPNLNPPRGIVPTLKKYIEIEKLSTPNIHVFGYGYELDTRLLTQISEVGSGTYSYIPDCSMVGTVFVNFMASALATITNKLCVSFKELNPEIPIKQIIGYERNKTDEYKIGAIQYGQNRRIVIKFDESVIQKQLENIGKVKVVYGPDSEQLIQQVAISRTSKNKQKMLDCLLASKYILLLSEFYKANKIDIQAAYKKVDEFYAYVQKQQTSQFQQVLLKELKNEKSESEGQVSKAFEKQEWYEKWGRHYIPSLLRAHLMQTCTNFKDPALQLYGGHEFQSNRNTMDTIFIKMAPPKPSAKKVEKLVYVPAPVDMSDYYNYGGGCIYGDCSVMLRCGERVAVKHLKKGDEVIGGTIQCVVKTSVFKWMDLIQIGNLLITQWHPVRIDGRWQFPSEVRGAKIRAVFVEQFFNFVMSGGISLDCEGIECIGLGHNITNDKVAHHPYLGNSIVNDLKLSPGWGQGSVRIRSMLRDPLSHHINGVVICD